MKVIFLNIFNVLYVLERELHGVSCVVWKSCFSGTLTMVSQGLRELSAQWEVLNG